MTTPPSIAAKAAHTPEPWKWEDRSGAGLVITGAISGHHEVRERLHGTKLPDNVFMWNFVGGPAMVQIACERWVQFSPAGWDAMQKANAARACDCVNLLAGHDLSAVAIVPVVVMEAARRSLQRAQRHLMASVPDCAAPPLFMTPSVQGAYHAISEALAALEAKADAGVQ